MVAKIDQKLPVFACISIGDRRYVCSGDWQARISKQTGMQSHLNRTSIGWRQDLRTRQVEFQEFVSHMKATLSTAVEQMMTTGNPKIVHFRSRSAIEIKSTASPGSSSPSIKENARAGFGPLRGRNVRNDSLTAPSSKDRCTAISVSTG